MENAKSVVVKDLFFLDALRGIAALIVMIGHARWLLWEGYSEGFVKHPQDYSLVGKVFVYVFSVFRYGHQAVMFFFILSGFLIHLKYSRQLAHNPSRKFGLKDYLYKRIKRIYPPFLFALLLTFLLDVWGIGMDYTIYFGKTPNNLLNSNISVNHSLINLVGNLFFLQNENIVIWGTNNPLWSLKYEWWFYLIYPLVFLINRKSVFASLIFVLMVFATASFIQVREGYFFSSVFQYLFLWWLGTFLADIYTKRIKLNFFYLSFFVLILPVMVLVGGQFTSVLLADTFWALGFFGLLSCFFYLQHRGVTFSWTKKIKWLGDCSYTMYIIHFPILVLFNGVILHFTNNTMPKSLVFCVAAIVFVTGFSYLIHFIIEKPFISKRAVVSNSGYNN